MRRFFKVLAWLIGGTLLLLLVAVIAVYLIFDPNDYKPQIVEAVERHTGRQLVLDGDLSLSLFPWLGIETGPLSLSNPPGFTGEAMLSVTSAQVRLKVIPLLRKEFQLDTVELYEPVVRLQIDPRGRSNWEDLAPANTAPEIEDTNKLAKVAGALVINGLIVNQGSVFWQDQSSRTSYEITDLHIETGKVLHMTPVEVKVRGKFKSDSYAQTRLALRALVLLDTKTKSLMLADTQLTASALDVSSAIQVKEVRIDQSAKSISLTEVSSTVGYAGESYNVVIDRLNLFETGRSAKVDNIRVSGRISNIDLAAQLTGTVANLERQTLTIPTFSVRAGDAKITGLMSAQQILVDPRFRGRIQTNRFNLRALLQKLNIDWEAGDKKALSTVQLVSEFELSTGELFLKQFQGIMDDTTASGIVAISGFERPRYQFDVRLGDIDVDRYLPAATIEKDSVKAPGAVVFAMPALLLQEQDANGVVSVNSLRVSGFTVERVLIGVNTLERVVTIKPLSADLYGGKLLGTMKIDTSVPQPQVTIEQSLSGVHLGPVLDAANITNRVDGIGDLHLKAKIQQQDTGQSLQGETRFLIREGVVKGLNIRKLLFQARDIYSRAKGREPAPQAEAPEQEQFQFTEMQGSVKFDQLMATNQDLRIKSPLLRVLGSGQADLAQRNLDYDVEVYVVESARGQGGEELTELRGIPIPISIGGTFQQPQYRINVDRLLQLVLDKQLQKEQRKLQRKFENKLRNKLEKLLQ